MTTINFLAATATLISTDTGVPVRFVLQNDSGKVLKLFWIDRSGNELPYHTIANGGVANQTTNSTHAWLLKSDDGSVAMKFLPSFSGKIIINANAAPTVITYSEQVTVTSEGLWSTAQGYGLIDAAKSLGVADTADLPTAGQNNNGALNAMNASAAWAAGYTGKGVKVAVVDAGIGAHAEVSSKIVAGYDFYENDTNASPDNGNYKNHALGVASIIAASHNPQSGADTMGVAPDASLINVRVGSSQGSSSDKMALGIRYAVDQGAKVICMPLQSSADGVDKQVADAVHYAYQKNVVVVIIGGNFSSYGATGPALIAQQFKGEAIDVGNFNIGTGAAFASSNMPGANPFSWVMASSSGYVPNLDGGYTYWQDGGTSFAGPYVAGLAALLWEQNPNATATQIMNKIIAGASLTSDAAKSALQVNAGTSGNDVIKAMAGVSVDAGAGIDVVQFAGNKAGYSVVANATGFAVTDKATGSVNLLSNVERLSFSDAAVALDVNVGNGGDIYRLYQAAFDRTPDSAGIGFWMNAMDKGTPLNVVADGFVNSAEFQKLYGANPTSEQLVKAMYQNVLHRAPDQAGLDFWMNAMSKGVTDEELLINFSNSAENKADVAEIIGQGFEYTPFG